MAVFSERSYEGCISLDHRASPGFSAAEAVALGYGHEVVGSTLFEAPTRRCNHCGTHVVINPDRQRERAHCFKCNMYICDNCALERMLPDYVHKTITDILDNFLFINSLEV